MCLRVHLKSPYSAVNAAFALILRGLRLTGRLACASKPAVSHVKIDAFATKGDFRWTLRKYSFAAVFMLFVGFVSSASAQSGVSCEGGNLAKLSMDCPVMREQLRRVPPADPNRIREMLNMELRTGLTGSSARLSVLALGKRAVPGLEAVLNEGNKTYSWIAADVMAQMAPYTADVSPVLVKGLRSIYEPVRSSSAGALTRLTPNLSADTISAIVRTMEDPSVGINMELFFALPVKGPQVHSVLVSLTRTAMSDLCVYALSDCNRARSSMGRMLVEDSAALSQPLADMIKSGNLAFRVNAALAIELMGEAAPEWSAAALSDLLKEKSADLSVRVASSRAIAALGEKGRPAVPALLASVREDHPSDEGTVGAVRALRKLVPEDRTIVVHLLNYLKSGKNEQALVTEHIQVDAGALALSLFEPQPRGAVPILLGLLHDTDREKRIRAAKSLVLFRDVPHEAVPALLKMLKSDDFSERSAAVQGMGACGRYVEEVGPELLAAVVHDGRGNYLERTMHQAFKTMGPIAGPFLAKSFREQNEEWHHVVWGTLENMGLLASTALPGLTQMADEPAATNLRDIGCVISRIAPKDSQTAEVLSRITRRSGSMDVLMSLSWVGKPALPYLMEFASSGNTNQRASALEYLANFGPPSEEMLRLLIRSLEDPDSAVRFCAAETLGHFGAASRSAIPSLLKHLGNAPSRYHGKGDGAAFALGRIGEAALPGLAAALQNPSPKVRAAACDALSIEGYLARGAVNQLIPLTRDENLNVRLAAIKALGMLGPVSKKAVPVIAPMIADGNREIFLTVSETLRKLGELDKMLPYLVSAAKRPEVRQEALSVALDLGKRAEPYLSELREALKEEKRNEAAGVDAAADENGGWLSDEEIAIMPQVEADAYYERMYDTGDREHKSNAISYFMTGPALKRGGIRVLQKAFHNPEDAFFVSYMFGLMIQSHAVPEELVSALRKIAASIKDAGAIDRAEAFCHHPDKLLSKEDSPAVAAVCLKWYDEIEAKKARGEPIP